MEEYFNNQAEIETTMVFRHPWVPLFYNWVIAAIVVVLFGGFVWWGLQIKTQSMADKMLATTLAEMDAENERMLAEAEARRAELLASHENVLKQWSNAGAQALYPLDNFITKYHYSDEDLETYLRSGWNRHILTGESLEEVFSAPQQYLGYADNNPVLKEFYDLAYRCFSEWEEEETSPCDPSFQWAELTENGIYLKNNFNATGYARRWRA